MSNICRFTVPASRDIEVIIDYIADNRGLDTAESYLKKINQKCSTIASFPNMRKRRDELFPMVKSFPVDNYLIFYRPITEGIKI